MLVDAGFADVRVEEKAESREFIKDWMPGSGCENYVVSANVTATKPKLAPVDETSMATDAVASSVAAAVAKAAGVSLAAAGPAGRAVSELVAAFAAVARAVGEHHAQHTSAPGEEETSEPEPEPVEEKKAGC
jgi:arsenite methyltransferase